MPEQIIYTINRAIPGHLQSGYGIYSETEGIPEGDRADVLARFSSFKPPMPISGPDDPNLELIPKALAFGTLKSGKMCVAQKTFTGYIYGMPSRYNNYVSHSFICDDLEGYPIEYMSSPSFCTGIDFDGMDVTSAPASLDSSPPALESGRAICLESTEKFVESRDKGFLRLLTYRILDACDRKDKVLLCADWKETPFWIAAVTMLFPKKIADRMTFVTYVHPDNAAVCEETIMGLYERRRGQIREGIMTSDDEAFDPSETFDGPFNEYIDGAYGGLREGFFGFLAKAEAETPGKDIIGLYDLYCIAEKGMKLSGDSLDRAWEALKKYGAKLPAECSAAAVECRMEVLDDADVDFIQNDLCRSLKDEECVRKIRIAVAKSRLQGMDGLRPSELMGFYERNRGSIADMASYRLGDCMGSLPGACLAAKYWSDSRSKDSFEAASAALSQAGPEAAEFILSDRPLAMAALGSDSPASESLKRSLLEGMLSSKTSLDEAARLAEVIGYDADLQDALDDRMAEGPYAGAYVKGRCESLIAEGKTKEAESMYLCHCESASTEEMLDALEFLGAAGKPLEKACIPTIAKRFESMPGDFLSEKKMRIAHMLAEIDETLEGSLRTALYLTADSISLGTPADLDGYDSLSPEEKRSFCRRALRRGVRMDEEWFESRLAPFVGHESSEFYEAAADIVRPTIMDSPEVLAAYIVAVGKTGIDVSDLTYKSIPWRGRPSRLERVVEKIGGSEEDLETYYEHSERPPEEKGGFLGGWGSKESDSQTKEEKSKRSGGKDPGSDRSDSRKEEGQREEGGGNILKGLKGLFKK